MGLRGESTYTCSDDRVTGGSAGWRVGQTIGEDDRMSSRHSLALLKFPIIEFFSRSNYREYRVGLNGSD